jgi:hypothetical protein
MTSRFAVLEAITGQTLPCRFDRQTRGHTRLPIAIRGIPIAHNPSPSSESANKPQLDL